MDPRFNQIQSAPAIATQSTSGVNPYGHVDTTEYQTPDAHWAWTGQYLYDRYPTSRPGVGIEKPMLGGVGPQLPPIVQQNLNGIQARAGGNIPYEGSQPSVPPLRGQKVILR